MESSHCSTAGLSLKQMPSMVQRKQVFQRIFNRECCHKCSFPHLTCGTHDRFHSDFINHRITLHRLANAVVATLLISAERLAELVGVNADRALLVRDEAQVFVVRVDEAGAAPPGALQGSKAGRAIGVGVGKNGLLRSGSLAWGL